MTKKTKDIKSMNENDRKALENELKMELIKSGVRGQKTKMKTKDIKRALARIFTFNRADEAKRLSKN